MRIDKVVLRSILSTLAAIGVLFVGLMLSLVLIFPSTMMGITYDLGMDGAAVRFARSAYNRSGEVSYIAFATETAIGIKDMEKVKECGLKLLDSPDFSAYCDLQDNKLNAKKGTYKNYIYSNLCLAVYDGQGVAEGIALAIAGTGNTFSKGNPISVLLVYAISKGDRVAAESLYTEMQNIQPTEESEIESLNELKAFAYSFLYENV